MKKYLLYNLSGEYWGFVYGNFIFNINNEYYGWVDEMRLAWFKNGKYLGHLYNKNYVIVNKSDIKPISRIVVQNSIENIKYNTSEYKQKKMKRIAPQGFSDALKKIINDK